MREAMSVLGHLTTTSIHPFLMAPSVGWFALVRLNLLYVHGGAVS